MKSYTKTVPLYVQTVRQATVQQIAPFLDPVRGGGARGWCRPFELSHSTLSGLYRAEAALGWTMGPEDGAGGLEPGRAGTWPGTEGWSRASPWLDGHVVDLCVLQGQDVVFSMEQTRMR